MEVKSRLEDLKINAVNVLVEIPIIEYVEIAREVLKNNELQRRRVKSSSTVYSLLKRDLKEGCIIPPIVLALNIPVETVRTMTNAEIINLVVDNSSNLLILDGLQRTYTLLDLRNEIMHGEEENISLITERPLRVEFYIGINKIGILYRMLTLNTGQTPMSLRHQIEILYSDYLVDPPEGVKLLTESDDQPIRNLGEYKFKDVIDGFDSYLERDELPIDRGDILDNIRSLEKLSKENNQIDLFVSLIEVYNNLVKIFDKFYSGFEFNKDVFDHNFSGAPFGKNILRIFSKSQPLTGFGSAIGKLIDFESIESISELNILIVNEENFTHSENDMDRLLINLDLIRSKSRKIGNDQRLFFHYFFRELFEKRGDSYLNISNSIEEGYKAFQRKTL